MSDFKKIRLELLYEEQVLRIWLNHPKGNVIDKEMMTEMIVAIKEASPSLKAFIFQGEGKHFSFGASVQEHQKDQVGEMLATFHKLFRVLIESRKPCFALVSGQCLGGGLELAAFCHWIFAAEDTNLGQPEMNLGVFPPVASLLLPHRIGQQYADDLVLTGRTISAIEAREMGLVSVVSANPEEEMLEFIKTYIIPKSASSLALATQASRYEMYQSLLKNLYHLEKMYLEDLMTTFDAEEGLNAFLEKRKPNWN